MALLAPQLAQTVVNTLRARVGHWVYLILGLNMTLKHFYQKRKKRRDCTRDKLPLFFVTGWNVSTILSVQREGVGWRWARQKTSESMICCFHPTHFYSAGEVIMDLNRTEKYIFFLKCESQKTPSVSSIWSNISLQDHSYWGQTTRQDTQFQCLERSQSHQ